MDSASTRASASATIPTPHGSRYLQQLCKHWSRQLEVHFDARSATIIFPRDGRGADWPGKARFTMTAQESSLECRIDASAPEQLEGLKNVVAVHLDRFAFREAPLRFDWREPRHS